MKQSVSSNLVGFVDFDPAGPTTIVRGNVLSVAVNGTGDFAVALDPNNALDPTASNVVPTVVGGALDGSVDTDHTTDTNITVLTATAGVAADRRFQLRIYDMTP